MSIRSLTLRGGAFSLCMTNIALTSCTNDTHQQTRTDRIQSQGHCQHPETQHCETFGGGGTKKRKKIEEGASRVLTLLSGISLSCEGDLHPKGHFKGIEGTL